MASFTGVLVQDSASAAFLNLSITLGAGVVTGSLTGAGGVIQVIIIIIITIVFIINIF